ncbi:hypothetical protein SNE40_000028 [Patella caerulea]|uniref:Uncharacterized protein n=1 Tax=Patella caerulea TaxID=87958 RepID=A0AAN8KIN3_PATCE
MFGIEKGSPVKKMDNAMFREQASVFCVETCSSQSQIIEAGKKALVCLYGSKPNESLDTLRLRKFKEKAVTETSVIEMRALPPTSDFVKYHSLRVFLQVRCWMGDDNRLNPTDWGWELRVETLLPRCMDTPLAPPHRLKVLGCTCKGGVLQRNVPVVDIN